MAKTTEPQAAPTIGDYALLGNCQGSALVSRSGSIDWACLPSFDAPACFARILGEPGGFWSISPTSATGSVAVTREYAEDTTVLVTQFDTGAGRATLTDYMPLHRDDRYNDIGKHSPAAIHRIVEGVDGRVEFDIELAIRPEFGLTTPLIMASAPGS